MDHYLALSDIKEQISTIPSYSSNFLLYGKTFVHGDSHIPPVQPPVTLWDMNLVPWKLQKHIRDIPLTAFIHIVHLLDVSLDWQLCPVKNLLVLTEGPGCAEA